MAAPLDVSGSAMWEVDEAEPADLDASDLYADAAAKAAMYARLSRNAAAEGDVAIAVAAAWSADVHAVQALWWERARDAGGGPFEPFLAMGATISGAASGAATSPANILGVMGGNGGTDGVVPPAADVGRDDPGNAASRAPHARGVIEAARRGLLAGFDPHAAMLVSSRFTAVDHLSALPAPTSVVSPRSSGAAAFTARLAGRTPHDLLVDLANVAVDCRMVARGLEAAGFVADAVEQLVLAETANFEAYLLQVSVAVGDVQLLGADLRRAALADVLPAPRTLPQEVAAARLAVREVMRGVLGAGELARFARLLYAYDAAEVSVSLPEPVVAPRAFTLPAQARPVEPPAPPVQRAPVPAPMPEPEPEPEPAPPVVLASAPAPAPEPEPEPEPAPPVVLAHAPRPVPAPAQPKTVQPVPHPVSVPRPVAKPGLVSPPQPVPAPRGVRSLVIVRSDDLSPEVPAAAAVEPVVTEPEVQVPAAVLDVVPEDVLAVEDEDEVEAESEVDAEVEVYVAGPPALPPATPLRHRDIFAQDIGGQGPRVGGFGPGNR